MERLGRFAARAAIGAAAGAVAAIGFGQLVALVAARCTFACQPTRAATAGALIGAIAVFAVRPYRPG